MNERLQEKGHGQLHGHEGALGLHERSRNLATNLPHETITEREMLILYLTTHHVHSLKVRVLENIHILQEVLVVLPNPVLQLLAYATTTRSFNLQRLLDIFHFLR